jgi:hypothetical protein
MRDPALGHFHAYAGGKSTVKLRERASKCLLQNLFFCKKTICEEASTAFYNKNMFCFEGDHNWDPIVSWLKMIGSANLNSLRSLQVNGKRPDQVWQNSKGKRLRHPCVATSEEIYPRHPYLLTPGNVFRCGEVDNINPAIEDVFILLGQRSSEQKIILCMQLGMHIPSNIESFSLYSYKLR